MSALPLVIINPASAGGATGEAWPQLAGELRQHFGAFNCALTKRRGDAAAIARHEAELGRRFVIACGGDGTISEVVNGLLQSGADAELGVLPSGTGGDFRRTLGIPVRAADAATVLRCGRTRRMDAGRVHFVNHEGAAETRYFINVASCGMGGEVVRRLKEGGSSGLTARSARLIGGKLAFAFAALQTTLTFAKPAIRLQLDDGAEVRLVVANLCIANAKYFGGGMKVAPTARLDDGLLDAVAIGDMSALSILANSYRIYLGTHLGMQQVRHARVRRLSAQPTQDADVLLEIDGEVAGRLPATFEILPRALSVRCP